MLYNPQKVQKQIFLTYENRIVIEKFNFWKSYDLDGTIIDNQHSYDASTTPHPIPCPNSVFLLVDDVSTVPSSIYHNMATNTIPKLKTQKFLKQQLEHLAYCRSRMFKHNITKISNKLDLNHKYKTLS